MNLSPRLLAAAFALAAVTVTAAPRAAKSRPLSVPFDERQLAERGLVIVRVDPKLGAPPNECDDVTGQELAVAVDGVAAKVISVERVPRPERHWLLLDVSGSADLRRKEAIRSARTYLRRVMTPELDSAAVLTADDDTLLVDGPRSDPERLDARLADVPGGAGSALRDALSTVIRQTRGDRREHLILFWTDGQDTQSLTTVEDLLSELQQAPNATVFSLVLGPSVPRLAGFNPVGPFVFDAARRSGGEVFAANDPQWLERVRGWITRRFTVTLAPPAGAGFSKLRVTVPGRRCEATILPDPFADPDAVAGATPSPPASWIRIHNRQRKKDDPACVAPRGETPWESPLVTEENGLRGCVLDAVQAAGYVVRGTGPGQSVESADARIVARDVRVIAPPLAALSHDLVDAIPLLLPKPGEEPGGRSPSIIEGTALLTQRARIASSLFAARPDYRDFALARLARWADDDLHAIERDIRRAFPDLDAEAVSAVARASRAGQRAVASARTPTDADLARALAAWLDDLPASELFRAWELRLVDARLAGAAVPDAASQWAALRAWFGQPQNLRVAAPLVLLYDERRDVVGFRRIVLPRPMGYHERAEHLDAAKDRAEDRIPERPLALDVLEQAMARKDVRERLSSAVYRASRIDYERRDPTREARGEDPFKRARVTLTLEAPGRPPMVLGSQGR